MRAGEQLALVGPHFICSTIAFNSSSGTSRDCHLLCVRALSNSLSNAVEQLNHLNLVMPVGRNEEPRRSGVRLKDLRKLNRLDRLHVRTEVLEQVFDPVTERGRRTRATRASAAHVKINDALSESGERDVATVLSDCRPDTRLEQLLDSRYRCLIFGIVTTGGPVV